MPGGPGGAGNWCCGAGGGKREKEEGQKTKRKGLEEVKKARKKREGKGRINNYGLLSTASHCAKCFANFLPVLTTAL